MNCATYVKRNFEETSIHGLPYLIRQDLHWTERVFWLSTVVAATYFSINLCLNQWQRFRDSPTVLGMELTWDKRDFPYAGVTLCSDFRNEETQEQLIRDTWGLTTNDTQYTYYWNFLEALNVLRYDSLHTLTPYQNDSTLESLDIVSTLRTLRRPLATEDPNAFYSFNNLDVLAITEAGLCRTTSQFNEYTNPNSDLQHQQVSKVQYCDFMSVCTTKLVPSIPETANVFVYLHNVFDVVPLDDRNTIFQVVGGGRRLEMDLEFALISAESEMRNLPVAYRKCRYPDENLLQYFKTYNLNLCRMECRIHKAMELCQCKPFFYAVAPHLPNCTVDQLLCLSQQNWTETKCNCLPLCEVSYYVILEKIMEETDLTQQKFERTIRLSLFRPYMAFKRHVVFNTDQLLVSFGGAVSLFLGASFITCYSIVQIFGDFIILNCLQSWLTNRATRLQRGRQVQFNFSSTRSAQIA